MKNTFLKFAALFAAAFFAAGATAQDYITIPVECEDFEYMGGWSVHGDSSLSGKRFVTTKNPKPAPAFTAVSVPKAGKYTLWVRSLDFPENNPGARRFKVSINGKLNSKDFGVSGKEGYVWEKGDLFDLPAGQVVIGLHDDGDFQNCRADAIILTTKPMVPRGTLAFHEMKPAKPVRLEDVKNGELSISPVKDIAKENEAEISNAFIKAAFAKALKDGKETYAPRLYLKEDGTFKEADTVPAAESYQIVKAAEGAKFEMKRIQYHPRWTNAPEKKIEIRAGGKTFETLSANKDLIWNAGQGAEAVVKTVKKLSANALELEFYPLEWGALKAVWRLDENENFIRVSLSFTPKEGGQYALGYFVFERKDINDVEELLMPMLVQRKRFPEDNYSMLQTQAPTPLSIMQLGKGADALTIGVAGAAEETPFEFPTPAKSRYALQIKDHESYVHPSVYGPMVGLENSYKKAGEKVKFSFNIILQKGDWYAAYRNAADNIFKLSDYRRNTKTSLSEACLNMIDLFKNDEFGGWWAKPKGFYQIESKNGVTNASPLTALSLYRLTGDYDLYRRRALPTMEFMLSRTDCHFSSVPSATGNFTRGATMNGPVRAYGASTYAGLAALCNGFTPHFFEIAFPVNADPRVGSQNPVFDEWLAKYLQTGDSECLKKAVELADLNIKAEIDKPASEDVGLTPFFLVTNVPHWDSYLRLYEVTGEKRFLDAAAKGAHILMTGIWTQPLIPQGSVKIYKGDNVGADKSTLKLHKGAETFRLNFPEGLKDIKEKSSPAWETSNVGLGFEQPCTYTYVEQGGRMILQAPWSSGFLRLAQYTQDKDFETYARNAVLGRWGNYPGYYYTDFIDLMQDPAYPYKGPDVGYIYYHHLPVHLAWAIDYLISDAALVSKGQISFPAQRQFGYAFFDYLIYGHAAGQIYGHKDAWLWFKKNLVKIDNPQINYICAHSDTEFFVILTNQAKTAEKFTLYLNPSAIAAGSKEFTEGALTDAAGTNPVEIKNNRLELELKGRAQTMLTISGLKIDVPAHKSYAGLKASAIPSFVSEACQNKMRVSAAAIKIEPSFWDAYIWINATPNAFKTLELKWQSAKQSGAQKCDEYPYEFTVPQAGDAESVKLKLIGTLENGDAFESPTLEVGAAK